MDDPLSSKGSECQFREAGGRCIFVDGHPGAHVCIGAHSARVAIRGAGEIPDPTYLSHAPDPAWPSPPAGETGRTGGEAVWAGWNRPMVVRLLEEIHEAGVAPPHDWVANFRRLRGER